MFNNTTIFKHFQSHDHKMTSLSIRFITKQKKNLFRFIYLLKPVHTDKLFMLYTAIDCKGREQIQQCYVMLRENVANREERKNDTEVKLSSTLFNY